MLFNSGAFLVLLCCTLAAYFSLRSYRWQNVLLLVVSYGFYAAWDVRFVWLIIASTLVDYVAARGMSATASQRKKRLCLLTSLGMNLGMLGFFKYYNFGVESVAALLEMLGMQADAPTLNIILPVGISFYTFQTISYTVDVYRGQREPVTDLLDFALYVAYFPQLVAGPIEKSTTLLPQFQRPRRVTWEDVKVGLLWMLLGYFQKVAIADALAPLVDYSFAHPDRVSGAVSLIAILAFAIQIYCDFCGYTLIARGVSQLMGIRLSENFNAPYLARSPRDFWHRWHISLSSWLREYLYFGLGGSRRGAARTHINLMLTMLLGGLWHGARWNFVIWGAYHGLLLVACHLWTGRRPTASEQRPTPPMIVGLQILGTFALTLLGWLLFRVENMQQLAAIVGNIATNFVWTEEALAALRPTLAMFALLMAYDVWQSRSWGELTLRQTNPWLRLGLCSFAIVCVVVVGFRPTPFVYFQF